jgi:peptidoglycan/xylan/chitin deacetylase (PgdA/CDA1 family)
LFPPFKVPGLLKYLYPSLEWEVKTNEATIYITFDDGPDAAETPFVLNELQKFNAKATFFCVGQNAERYPQLMQDIINKGHRIGNHTHNHLKGWKNNHQDYIQNIYKAAQHTSSDLFRPPYGRIKRNQARMLLSKNYRIVMWSLLSCDYLPNLNAEKSLNALLKHSKAGSIVVFHDSKKSSKNLRAILPAYLREMHDRGFTFAAL